MSNSGVHTESRTEPCGSNKDSVWTPKFDMKHLKKAEGHIGRNFVNITLKMRSIFRKTLKHHRLKMFSFTRKLLPMFAYIDSNVLSTENNVNISLAKAWIEIYKFSIMWEFNLSDKIEWVFFQVVSVSILLHGCTTWRRTKRIEKKLNGEYPRMLRAILYKS